jgi:hypothetical protein
MSRRVVLAFTVAMSAFSPAYGEDVFPLGVWTDARHRMVVRIAPCETGSTYYCGIVVHDNRRGRPTNPPGHVVIRSLAPADRHWAGQAFDGPLRVNFTLHPSANGDVKARLCLTSLLCLNEKLKRVTTLVAR